MACRRHAGRGVVLIIVLGILVLLSLLAASFATLASVERAVARNYLDGVRARLLAQAGVETALVRLGEIASMSGFLDDPSWTSGDGGEPSFSSGKAVRLGGRAVGISGTMETGAYGRNGDLFILRIADANSRIPKPLPSTGISGGWGIRRSPMQPPGSHHGVYRN
jgi:hypothetical protein